MKLPSIYSVEMKQASILFLFLAMLLTPIQGVPQQLPVPPTATPISADFSGVIDYADLIDETHERQMATRLNELKQKTTASIVVFTIRTNSPAFDQNGAEAYAARVFAEWNLNRSFLRSAAQENTTLFLAFLDEQEKIHAVVHRGQLIRELIDNVKSERILGKYAEPAFAQKEYAKGIYEATWAIAIVLAQAYQKTLDEDPPFVGDPLAEESNSSGAFWLIGLVVIAAFIYQRMRQTRSGESVWSWLPGRRRRVHSRPSQWKGAFGRGGFGGVGRL
jgi:uncharacterized membrane protein YgcG